jgi:protein-S-isoprenylcysteine O-methyltransferase Ste14
MLMELTSELVARIVVIACAVSLLLFGLAVLAVERLSRRPAPVERETGLLALVNYVGILGFVAVGLVSAVTMIGTAPAPPDPIHAIAVMVGLIPLALAGLLALWGYRSLGREFSSEAEVRPDTVLITQGAFGLVRHPMYLSILLLWSGSALALWSPVMAVCWLVLVPAFIARSRTEERILTSHFGAAYSDYAARVPMLLPGFRRGAEPRP